jgi:TonB-linked SusC/RagA family outer membrane protein
MKYAGTNTTGNYFITGAGVLHIKNLVKDLTIDLSASRRFGVYSQEIDRVFLQGNGRNGANTAYPTNSPSSSVQKVKNESMQDKLEALVNYKFDTGKHSVALLGGASYEQWTRDQTDVRANGLLSDELFSFNFYDSGVAANSILSDLANDWKMASLFGRINYSYASRYLLELVARYDGSSRLQPGNRFGFFPGVSAGWVLSEESFFEGIKNYLNFFKLRGSYGEVGNSTALNNYYYPYIGFINKPSNNRTYMGQRWYYRSTMPAADLRWETVVTTNVGADMAFLKQRLNLTADYYWKTNRDMLSPMAPGNIVGVEKVPWENVGKLKTWGWELSLGWHDKIGNVRYNASINIADSRNKLVEYEGDSGIAPGINRLLKGYPINTLWGYQTDGFWSSSEEYLAYKAAHQGYETFAPGGSAPIGGGDVHYVTQPDANGNTNHLIGTIGNSTPDDPGDLVYLGDASPRYEYGINLGAEWKGFDISCFFQGVGKRNFFIRSTSLMPLGVAAEMPWTIHRDHWTEDNPNAYFARIYEQATHNYQYADRWIQNGAYIRLKNIQLGYTVPLKKYIHSLRIYVTGNDVWEHTNMLKCFDPEFGNQLETRTSTNPDTNVVNDRVNRNYYPFMRTWMAGINLTF